jgi:predicted dehydrogenase
LGCIERGVHVMIEKPPGCTSEEAARILDTALENHCKVMVSMNRRFIPLIRWARQTAAGRGGVVHCSVTYNKAGFVGEQWRWPSYVPVADGIHLLDLLRFMCGPVVEVYACSNRHKADYVNSCSALVVFESGALGSANNHQCVGGRVQRLEVHAEGMSAYFDIGDTTAPRCELFVEGRSEEPPSVEFDSLPTGVPVGVGIDAYLETRHFARWIAGEEEGESDLADVIDSVRLAEAVAVGYRGKMSDFDSRGLSPP